MKAPAYRLLICLFAFTAAIAQADSVPELLHYKFESNVGTSVPNLASTPPVGTDSATLMGGLTAGGADLNGAGNGYSVLGTGVTSSTDYLNTGWATNLSGTSFTISFKTANIGASSTLFYIFGDLGAGSFRCFTNGIAGPSNWVIRGTNITDTYANGAATVAPHRTTFVYNTGDNTMKAYIDGALVSTVAQPAGGPVIAGAGPFKVVGYSTNVGMPSGGLLDDFRIYNRALTDTEVAEIDVDGDIRVSKTNLELGLLPDRQTTYTIQVENAGWTEVSSVQIVDDVPDVLTNSTWTCASTPVGLCPNASGGPDINETTGPLVGGAMLEYTLTATPSGMLPEFITNTVTATSADTTDFNSGNNSATDTDPVVPEGIFIDGFEDLGPGLLRTPISR